MENSIAKAYAEVDKILSFMEQKYVDKIPSKLIELFKNEKSQDYDPDIQPNVPLTAQKLQNKTLALLAMLHLNYWCESESKKHELLKLYANNDKKVEETLREKNNLFKNIEMTKPQQEIEQSTVLIEYKESNFFKKILNKIMNFLRRK